MIPAVLDELSSGLEVGYEAWLVQGPSRLVLAGGRQPHPKVVAPVPPVQLVEPVTCTSSPPQLPAEWNICGCDQKPACAA